MEDTKPPTATPPPPDFTLADLLRFNQRFHKQVIGTNRAPLARNALYEFDAARIKTCEAWEKLNQAKDMVGGESAEYLAALRAYYPAMNAEKTAMRAVSCTLPPVKDPMPGDIPIVARYVKQLIAAPYPTGSTDDTELIRRKMTADIVECAYIEAALKLHDVNDEVLECARKSQKAAVNLLAAKARQAVARSAYNEAIHVLSQFAE
jgi:hypothetical protein